MDKIIEEVVLGTWRKKSNLTLLSKVKVHVIKNNTHLFEQKELQPGNINSGSNPNCAPGEQREAGFIKVHLCK